jgi:hypothetical protein
LRQSPEALKSLSKNTAGENFAAIPGYFLPSVANRKKGLAVSSGMTTTLRSIHQKRESILNALPWGAIGERHYPT